MNWKELLAAFGAALTAELSKIDATTDEGRKARRELLQAATNDLPQDARQHLHDLGFGVSHARHAEDQESWKRSKAEMETEVASLRQKIEEAKTKGKEGGHVDTGRVQELEGEITKLRGQIDELGQQHTAALGAERRSAFRNQLESTLTRLRGVDPLIARARVADEEWFNKVVKLNEQDNSLSFYTPDGLAPLSIPQGTDPADFLASQIVQTIDPKYVTSGVRSGSGASGSQGTSAPSNVATQTVKAHETARAKAYNPIAARRAQTSAPAGGAS